MFLLSIVKHAHFWVSNPSVPPPLNLLSIPYIIIIWPVRKIARITHKTCSRPRSRAGRVGYRQAAFPILEGPLTRSLFKSRSTTHSPPPSPPPSPPQSAPPISRLADLKRQSTQFFVASHKPRECEPFKFPPKWLEEHDVATMAAAAASYKREAEQQNQIASGVVQIGARVDEIAARLDQLTTIVKSATAKGGSLTVSAVDATMAEGEASSCTYLGGARSMGALARKASASRKAALLREEAKRRRFAKLRSSVLAFTCLSRVRRLKETLIAVENSDHADPMGHPSNGRTKTTQSWL